MRMTAVSLVLALGLAGCGGSAGGGAGGELSGSISIDGSSTVAPVSEAVAEEFQAEAPDVEVSVATSGTGGGFKKFCDDEIDISDASRAIKEDERAACAAKGVEYLELRVGLDGLAVVTSRKNRFLDCLDFDQLKAIFGEGGAETWDQVDPSFPKAQVAVFGPGTDSGTFDFFVEEVLGPQEEPGSTRPRAPSDYTASENDNTLVQGIEGEENSWGFFGFAYYQENEDGVKAVEVAEEAGGECVAPDADTVASGDYPLSRPLYIYVNKADLARPEVAEFVAFYLEVAPDLVAEVGYVAAPSEDYEKGLAALEAAAG